MNSYVYRVLHPEEWADFQKTKVFNGNDLDKESGFIHLSQKKQLKKTINLYFKKKKIVILKIDTKKFGEKLIWEKSRGGIKFPHLYDSLTLESVVKVDRPNV